MPFAEYIGKDVVRLGISNCQMFLWAEKKVNGSQIKKTIGVRDTVYTVNLERIRSGSILQILSEIIEQFSGYH